jgi:tetratricopeptide (TPR) repeat protein
VENFSKALEAIKQTTYIQRAEQANPEIANAPRNPPLADVSYATGLAYYNLQRYRQAIEELKQAIALNPKRAQAYYGLALSYIAVGDRRSAEKQKQTLESLDRVFAAQIARLLAAPMAPEWRGSGNIFGPPTK